VNQQLTTGAGTFRLPGFFASISSVKTGLLPLEYLRIVRASNYPALLLSAYDLASLGGEIKEMRTAIEDALDSGKVILFDSGNYESYWKDDLTWTQAQFHDVVRKFPCSCAFSFDVKNQTEDLGKYSDEVAASLARDREAAGVPVFPIVHGQPGSLPSICEAVCRKTLCAMIAVPERELGAGITQRAQTVIEIRKTLDAAGMHDMPLHLLGTGNPLALAIYVAVGANSFDGLEWCQTAVNPGNGLLHHFALGELFIESTTEASTQALGVVPRILLQNLSFFEEWMGRLGGAARAESALPSEIEVLRARALALTHA
jgi:hypothetical protein